MFADTILMIRPDSFGYNHQTAASNSFQHSSKLGSDELRRAAIKESEKLRQTLVDNDIKVLYMYQQSGINLPDAVFPNNWFTTHADGTIILYPMCSPSRREEYNSKIIDYLSYNFEVEQIVDLRDYALKEQFLEGTGSLVFDTRNKIIFAADSIRTNPNLAEKISEHCSMQSCNIAFLDDAHQQIYHTNVCLSVGKDFIVVAEDNIADEAGKIKLKNILAETETEVLKITRNQLNNFCGNILQLQNSKKEPVLAMSTKAYQSFEPSQIKQLEKHTAIIHSGIPHIEVTGGGSVRCMLAEIFLKPKYLN